jgi:hypothetical protein
MSSASVPTSLPAGYHLTTGPQLATTNSHTSYQVRVETQTQSYFTTRIYRQSVRLGAKPLEVHDQSLVFFSVATEPLRS